MKSFLSFFLNVILDYSALAQANFIDRPEEAGLPATLRNHGVVMGVVLFDYDDDNDLDMYLLDHTDGSRIAIRRLVLL